MPVLDWSALRYLIVGAANTVFGLLVIFACKWLLGLHDIAANLVGYGCGILLSFVLNRQWTFRHRGAAAAALARFLLVTLAAYPANLVSLIVLIEMGVDGYLAQTIAIVPYTVVGYSGSRYFAFRESSPNHRGRSSALPEPGKER